MLQALSWTFSTEGAPPFQVSSQKVAVQPLTPVLADLSSLRRDCLVCGDESLRDVDINQVLDNFPGLFPLRGDRGKCNSPQRRSADSSFPTKIPRDHGFE